MSKLDESTARALAYFDDFTLRKGRDYFQRGKVASLKYDGDTDNLWGSVDGSGARKYKATVRFTKGKVVLTHCSCPVGLRCKHTAALLLAYLNSKENDSFSSEVADELFINSMKAAALAVREDDLKMLLAPIDPL